MKNILVIGAGYVGQVVAAGLAEIGNSVVNIDTNTEIIARLRRGESHLYEEGLEEVIRRNIANGRLSFSSAIHEHLPDAQVIYIAVGTPVDKDGRAELKYVMNAAHDLSTGIRNDAIIITKSTVPVGTNREILRVIKAHNPDSEVSVVSNPEFLQEGRAMKDFFSSSRILIGYDDERIVPILKDMYAHFIDKGIPFVWCGLETAELAKYASNAFLATRIALINQFAQVAEQCGARIDVISEMLKLDPRFGSVTLRPGPGFGGSCLPKDCHALVHMGRTRGVPFSIIESVLSANSDHQLRIIYRMEQILGRMKRKRIAIFGLAFKAHTSDVRDSAAMVIVKRLLQSDALIAVHDPQAIDSFRQHFGDQIEYQTDARDAAQHADAILLLTEWSEYRELDYVHIYHVMRTTLIFDTRNLLDEERMRSIGFDYYRIGG